METFICTSSASHGKEKILTCRPIGSSLQKVVSAKKVVSSRKFVPNNRRAGAPAAKVDICHHDEFDDTYHKINISGNAADKHLAKHLDGFPGDPVPGSPGTVFGADCQPVQTCQDATVSGVVDLSGVIGLIIGVSVELGRPPLIVVPSIATAANITTGAFTLNVPATFSDVTTNWDLSTNPQFQLSISINVFSPDPNVTRRSSTFNLTCGQNLVLSLPI